MWGLVVLLSTRKPPEGEQEKNRLLFQRHIFFRMKNEERPVGSTLDGPLHLTPLAQRFRGVEIKAPHALKIRIVICKCKCSKSGNAPPLKLMALSEANAGAQKAHPEH